MDNYKLVISSPMVRSEIKIACQRAAESLVSFKGLKNVNIKSLEKSIESYFDNFGCDIAFVKIECENNSAKCYCKSKEKKEYLIWQSHQ